MTRLEKFRRDVGGQIDQGVRHSGLKRSEIANKSGIEYKSLCRKMKDPAEMKLRELLRIAEAMGMSLQITIRGKDEEGDHSTGRMARTRI